MPIERFNRELKYQTMLSILQAMLKKRLISQADFEIAEMDMRQKYQPIFYAE